MYNKGHQGIFKHIDFLLFDLICLQFGFLLAYFTRHGIENPYEIDEYLNMSVFLSIMDIMIIVFYGSLKNVLKRGYFREFTYTLKHTAILFFSGITYLFLIKNAGQFSRMVLILTSIFYFFLTYCVRVLWKRLLRRHLHLGGSRALLVVSDEATIAEALENLKNHNYEHYMISGIVITDKKMTGQSIDGIPVVADKETVFSYASKNWVDGIFLNFLPTDPEINEYDQRFQDMGIVTHVKLLLHVDLTGATRMAESMGNYTVLTSSINAITPRQFFLKKLMDICGGLIGCILTCILTLIIGPIIFIKSPGPIFFSQIRVGKNGKKFRIYKFRSMYLDAEERKAELMNQNQNSDGFMFKMEFDPRIIGCERKADGTVKKGIGNFIRDFSLDEFPQFFNVLKGDMSMVGTRPPTVDEWERYDEHHRKRLATKPGLTGMWQVSGRSSITDFEEVVRLDTKYIQEWSIGLDIKIIFKTIIAVFLRKGAM